MSQIIRLISVVAFTWGVWKSADAQGFSHKYTKIIKTTSGPVRGKEVDAYGVQYKAFLGIPYAAPPVGNLRFRAPQPPARWNGVRDAVTFGSICHQPNLFERIHIPFSKLVNLLLTNTKNIFAMFMRTLRLNEDCLYLNVYTKELAEKSLKPVLFWIHGGGFFFGDGTDSLYGPELLVDEDIVLVTINYRLGAFGFFATNTLDATGNWGLKDQVAALRWVQDNIAQFGGDPKRVTIYGESSGAGSVTLHMMSPLSIGLFHGVIAGSGAGTCDWVVNYNQERISRNLARVMGARPNETEDPAKRVAYLRRIRARVFSDYIFDLLDENERPGGMFTSTSFAPVLEPPETKDAFLTEDPQILLSQGRFYKVPIMMGINSLEGSALFTGLSNYTTLNDLRKLYVEDGCDLLQRDLQQAVRARNDCPKVSQQLLDFYFEGQPLNRASPINFMKWYGDRFLASQVHHAQKWYARYAKKNNPLYLYYFSYDGEWAVVKNLIELKVPGVFHGDELGYLFKPRIVKMPRLSGDSPGYITKERMTTFITNFAKYGDPTPSKSKFVPIRWNPAYGSDLVTMHIDKNLTLEKELEIQQRLDFWTRLFQEYIGIDFYF